VSDVPANAARIWLVGAEVHLDLPSGGGHTVRVPANERGLALLLQVLRHRANEGRLAEPPEVTQYQLGEIYKQMTSGGTPMGPKAKAFFADQKVKAEALAELKELGID
jgi:hypothetical protein